jgi:HlyD family secretion protein
MTRTAIRGGPRLCRAGAVSLALAVVTVASACGSAPTAPPTARVERGTVAMKVAASGALTPVTSQNIGFQKGAKLVELTIRVGDTVTPGQILAREDDYIFRQTLNQQASLLQQQQAQLDRLIAGVTVPNGKDALDAAERFYNKTKKAVDEQVSLAHFNEEVASTKYEQDLKAFREAKAAYAACPTSPVPVPPCVGGEEAAFKATRTTAIASRTAYKTAKHNSDIAEANGEVTKANANTLLVNARNGLRTARSDRPGSIDVQAALVRSARAAVALAQNDVNNTILRAPIGGTVSAITGTVGEYLGAGAGTTALSPGSDAAIPGVGAAASSDAAGNAASGLSATRPGGGAFIVLNNLNTFQVIVPFEESDASKVSPNQKVSVNFDAVPDLERDGTVLSVAPTGVNISGVTNYYATVLLTESDPRLHAGQTAEVSVATQAVDNVLLVPNAAVLKDGGQTFVNVPGPDGKPVRTPFQPGIVGDGSTQVLSGLREGQVIQLPQVNAPPAQPSGTIGGG